MEQQGKEKYHGTKMCGFAYTAMIILFVLISFLGQLILSALNVQGIVYLVVNSLFSVISIFIVIALINTRRNKKIFLGVFAKKFNPKYILHALILFAGMFFAFGAVNDVLSRAVQSLGGVVSSTSLPMDNFWQFLILVVFYAILPAVEEECFFRGLLLQNFLKSGKPLISSLIVALSFALYHLSVAKFIYQFVFGFALGLLAEKSKSVVPCIVAHFLNNFIILLCLYKGWEIDLYNPWLIVLGVALLIVAAVLFLFVGENAIKAGNRHKEEGVKIKEFFLPFGIFGIVVCLVQIIGSIFAL